MAKGAGIEFNKILKLTIKELVALMAALQKESELRKEAEDKASGKVDFNKMNKIKK